MVEQAARLERLRDLLGLTPGQAAKLVGVSRFTWRRYEEALAPIPLLHLTLFAEANGITLDYVISGDLAGLPRELQRDLPAREAQDREVEAGRIPAVRRTVTRGKPRMTDKERNDKSRARAVREPKPS
jgi:transcriptional regulator with XRE-family HTH domain